MKRETDEQLKKLEKIRKKTTNQNKSRKMKNQEIGRHSQQMVYYIAIIAATMVGNEESIQKNNNSLNINIFYKFQSQFSSSYYITKLEKAILSAKHLNYQIQAFIFQQIQEGGSCIRNMDPQQRMCGIFYPLPVKFVEELNRICPSQLFVDSFPSHSLFINQEYFNTQMPPFLTDYFYFFNPIHIFVLQFLLMNIQEVLGEMLGDYEDSCNQNSYRGYIDSNSQYTYLKMQRPTAEAENSSQSNQQEELINQTLKTKAPQNQIILPPRKKSYISVSSQNRNKYLKTRKGANQQTNDLSIHVCTLVKSYFKEYLTFEKVQPEDQRKLKVFQQSSHSMNSLKQLLIPDNGKINQRKIYEENEENQQRGKKIEKFLAEKLQQPRTIKQILLKRKMRFQNKLVLLKYLQSVKKIVENPQQFKSWKNSQLSY